MKNNHSQLRQLFTFFCLTALLLVLNACSKKETEQVDPNHPGAGVVGNYMISFYDANGVQYDAAKTGAIGTISVAASGTEYVEVDQNLTLKNTNIFNPFPTSMRVVKNGASSVLLQTTTGQPIGTITDGNMDIKLVDKVYTTSIRAKRL